MTIDVEWADRALWAENVVREYEEKIAALCDALDAERKRVRVLRAALPRCMRWMDSEDIRVHDQIEADGAFARAALAATDDGGGA
jgi:hypothetical protein